VSITLLFLAIVTAIAGWWLLHVGITTKPWLEQGATSEMEGRDRSSLPASTIGLWVFLAVATSLFALLISAYSMRMPMRDWVPLPIPRVLWLNTAMLVLSSAELHWAQVAAGKGRMSGVKSALLAAGITTAAFLAGQILAWHQLAAEGYALSANPANAFFYLMTALHALHVSGGLVALGRTSAKVWSDDGVELDEVRLSVELCATYWHFLLAVWLVLFALLSGSASEFVAICRQALSL